MPAAELTALILGFGILARMMLNMRAQNRALADDLTRTRRHCAQLLRRVRVQRDNYGAALDEVWEEHKELRARIVELDRELVAYRAEDARRERRGEMLN